MIPAAAVGLVKTAARTLGTDLPPGLVAELDAAARLVAAAEALGAGPKQLHAALLTALEAGLDVYEDPAVRRAAFAHQLSTTGAGGAARQRADHDIAAALVEFSDELLGLFSTSLQVHLDALTAAAESGLLPDNLEDTRSISARGARAMAHWAAATEAIRLTDTATDAVMALADAAHVAVTRHNRPVLFTDANLDSFNDIIRTTGTDINVWSAAKEGGLKLGLVSSLSELIERLADYQQQVQAAIAAEQPQPERKAAHA